MAFPWLMHEPVHGGVVLLIEAQKVITAYVVIEKNRHKTWRRVKYVTCGQNFKAPIKIPNLFSDQKVSH